MNNNKNQSSSQMSTTHFNNNNNLQNDRLNAIRNNPHGRVSYQNEPINSNEANIHARENLNDSANQNINANGNNKQNRNHNRQVGEQEQNNSSLLNKFPNNKFGQGKTANNLRDRLNTSSPNMDNAKSEAMKKGADALKKSANPYAKAAGYAMSAIQKRKERKDKEEDKENAEEKEEEQSEEDTSSEVQEEKRGSAILKKLLPIIILITPFLLILLVLFSVISPVVTAYSWFTSLFFHKTDEASSYTIYSEQEEANRKAEQDYNNAILGSKDGSVKGIIQEYQEKYGVTIDWYLLNALITYRYTADSSDLYSSSGSEDIDESEFEERLKALESGETTDGGENAESSSSGSVDYSAAKKKIEAFASLMVVKNGDSYITDKEKNGVVYNNVLNSNTFKNYYKSMFADNTEESRKVILDYIYDYAEGAREFLEETQTVSGGVVGDTSIIHLQTCKQSYSYTTINGAKVYNNPPWNEGTNYPDYLNVKDYLKGVVSREIGVSESYKEAMKAQMVAALTYMIHDSNSGFNLKSGEMYFPSGTCRQATCSPTDGCTSVREPNSNLDTFYVGQNRFSSGRSHGPISESDNAILEEILNAVFGKIMVNKGVTSASFTGSSDAIAASYLDSCSPGKCFSQKGAMADAKSGMTYDQILAKYYSSYQFDIIDIQEGIYFESQGGSSQGGANLNEAYHYHQGDSEWGSLTLCGSGKISANGCNITSAAIVISVLKNQRITPATLQSRQGSISACSPSSRPQMIMNFAKLYGLTATEVNKSNQTALNDMLTKIATGKYAAVARIAPNSGIYSSDNGHYVAIVGVKTENGVNKLLVWDPGNTSSSRDNAWIDVNYLVKYLQSSYSFILIGS